MTPRSWPPNRVQRIKLERAVMGLDLYDAVAFDNSVQGTYLIRALFNPEDPQEIHDSQRPFRLLEAGRLDAVDIFESCCCMVGYNGCCPTCHGVNAYIDSVLNED